MLAFERHRRILDLLQFHGSLRTIEMASQLGVTDETIRKDFEALEKRGQLVRIHGGAIPQAKPGEELPLTDRQLICRAEKAAIARLAVQRIQPNETIFIDASSTALTLTGYLPDFPLTILTNAHNVFTALEGRPNLDLICTGGLYDPRSRAYIGLLAETSLRRFHIHRMFFSGNGLDLGRGVSENNSRHAAFKERVIPRANDVVFLGDHTKLGQTAPFIFGQIEDLSCVITDSGAAPDFVESLRQSDVEVLIA
jgi:DeoR/GlpR family transcriptional regulator of sugar metabolism